MLRAIIFDFDGIIVDSEPLIFRLTERMAAMEGWAISEEEYYDQYLALDDRGIVEHLYATHGRALNLARRDELVAWKARAYAEAVRDGLAAMPGAVETVNRLAREFPLAIASGSLRSEIEHLLAKLGLREKFAVLATADDVERSKPDPAVFFKALERLQQLECFRAKPVTASECLAIEDAPAGVRAAQAAGMKCLGIAHSRTIGELAHADWVARRLAEVNFARVKADFRDR